MHLIKPMTLAAKCSIWEGVASGFESSSKLKSSRLGHHYIEKPTVMVSHCWSSPYTQLVAILKRYDENSNARNFFWVDIFSMNQHDFADLCGVQSENGSVSSLYETMLEALTQSIRVPGCMLLALVPHQKPAVLTRAWCLYEIYIAWKLGAEVACGFVPEAEHSMKRSLLKDDVLLNEIISSVDAVKSEATKASDQEMILNLIKEAGVERFNSFVREKLASSLRLVALTTLRNVAPTNVELEEGISPTNSVATRSKFIHADTKFHSESSSCLEI